MALSKFSDLDLIDKPDCAGLKENGKCSRLKQEKCSGHSCPFKMTAEEEAASRMRAMRRLSTLGEREQDVIAGKYFGGIKAWP